MSNALEGSHLCVEHQGNYSHYDKHNCTVCKQAAEIAALREQLAAEQNANIERTAALVNTQLRRRAAQAEEENAALRNALSRLVEVHDAMGGMCSPERILAEEALKEEGK